MKQLLGMALFLVVAAPAGASSPFDARSVGMAGVGLESVAASLAQTNPAYRSTPPRDGARSREQHFALPIGLIGLWTDPPELDGNAKDFDLVDVIDAVWTSPWTYPLTRSPDANDALGFQLTGSDLRLDAGETATRFGDGGFEDGARSLLFEYGSTLALGRRLGTFHVAWLEGFTHQHIDFQADQALVDALAEGNVEVGRSYSAQGRAVVIGGLSHAVGYSRELTRRPDDVGTGSDWRDAWWDRDLDRPRVWLGLSLRRYSGLAFARVDGNTALTGTATDGGFDLGYAADLESATPRGFSNLGTGWGLDLGGVVRWRRWELSSGVQDLFASLHWDRVRLDRLTLDPNSAVARKDRSAAARPASTDLPVRSLSRVVFEREARETWIAQIETGFGAPRLSLGAERWVREFFAVRAGLERDTRGRWQLGGGFGWRGGGWGFDLGLRSHSRNFAATREVELAVGLVRVH